MGMPAIRALLLDVDGTLYRQGLLRGLMALELSTLPVAMGSVRRALQALRILHCFRQVREELRHRTPTGAPLAQLQYDICGERAGVVPSEVEHIVSEWMYRRPLKYLPYCKRSGLEGFITRSVGAGIKVGVFSDYPPQEKLQALGLADSVSLSLCATDPEINAFKPQPRGFLRACELWGLPPRDVLYVGDRLDVDVGGAVAAGMPCALLTGSVKGLKPLPYSADNIVTFTSFQGLAHVLHTHH